jgi:hypothetical protein
MEGSGMHGIIRLIQGLLEGDPTATYVLIFTVVGTVSIVAVTEYIQHKRKREKKKRI